MSLHTLHSMTDAHRIRRLQGEIWCLRVEQKCVHPSVRISFPILYGSLLAEEGNRVMGERFKLNPKGIHYPGSGFWACEFRWWSRHIYNSLNFRLQHVSARWRGKRNNRRIRGFQQYKNIPIFPLCPVNKPDLATIFCSKGFLIYD